MNNNSIDLFKTSHNYAYLVRVISMHNEERNLKYYITRSHHSTHTRAINVQELNQMGNTENWIISYINKQPISMPETYVYKEKLCQ